MDERRVVADLLAAGVRAGDPVAVAVAPGVGVGVSAGRGRPSASIVGVDPGAAVRAIEDGVRPRWVVWSAATASLLVERGVRIARCWDVAAVHRLLVGGWQAEPAQVWAEAHGLAAPAAADSRPPDLFSRDGDDGGHPDEPVRPDGQLRSDWSAGAWAWRPDRLARWAELAGAVAERQRRRLRAPGGVGRAEATARSESAAGLLCAELSADGLPFDRAVAERLLAAMIGPRPADAAESAAARSRRDADVLRHAPPGVVADLRSPGQVRTLLGRLGVEVADTRAWRLREVRDAHPLVDALLAWRRLERIATTYGYPWLDRHVGRDGRLRGEWSASDGAAGRMTATGGLHNMPAAMRPAVVADPDHVFVRADLGQIEPRVLAAVSGDVALARATGADDLYAPVAAQLGVDRATAKVAVLGAMYGQTTGHGAEARRRLDAAYPVAMAYLEEASRAARAGRDLRTYGGRRILTGPPVGTDTPAAPATLAARGRYGRNALVQGAAAELFKLWAVTVRGRVARLDGSIVLCLHDELLVHLPAEQAVAGARLLEDCLADAVARWAPDDSVRFVAEVRAVHRWSDAKPTGAASDAGVT